MIKIGFVLLSNSDSPAPSTRIAVLNMLPYLRRAGFDPRIVFEPQVPTEQPTVPDLADRLRAEGYGVVYFQKVHGDGVRNLALSLRRNGIRTVYGVCDLVNVEMADATDATITVTEYLKSLYPRRLQNKIHVIHDGIERPDLAKSYPQERVRSVDASLRAVLVTSHALTSLPVLKAVPPWLHVTVVGRYPRALGDRLTAYRWNIASKQWNERLPYLRFLLNKRVRLVPWSQESSYEALLQADIGIIPIETPAPQGAAAAPPAWKVKSENRLTMKMSIGLPVIATPIPSYEPVVEHGRNALFARSPDEWIEHLQALRDPVRRRQIGIQARESVLSEYSMDSQAEKLVRVLSQEFPAAADSSGDRSFQ